MRRGFGGTFAIKNAETSSAMLADKCDAVESTGAVSRAQGGPRVPTLGSARRRGARRALLPASRRVPLGGPARRGDGSGGDGALTGCTAAIAETGTIVLTAGPLEGRRALTLVPDLHICVVREQQIVELLPKALAMMAANGLERRPITFVSGPSATSDIELSRVEGVHGPRNLVVLVAKEPR